MSTTPIAPMSASATTSGSEHKPGDWLLIVCYDNGSGDFTCQHCPKTGIRYEHELRHRRTCQCGLLEDHIIHTRDSTFGHVFKPWIIRVGCVCAEKLTGDTRLPREHEKALKSRIRQKKAFLAYGWKISGKGNPFRKWTYGGHTYTIVIRSGFQGKWAYSYILDNGGGVDWKGSPAQYASSDEAKSSAFEELFPPMVVA